MNNEEYVYLNEEELKKLMFEKLKKAGLNDEHALEVATHLTYSETHGIHSHGSNRVKYYVSRIMAGGSTINPKLEFKQTGPCSGIYEGDNAVGYVPVRRGMEHAIELAKESGIGIVGVKNIGHSGTMSYYLNLAAKEDMVAITMCQSDPCVVPFGGREGYFGTNPFGYAVPQSDGKPLIFDMATSVQAWGKVINASIKKESIPDDWGLDVDGNSTTDPDKVNAMLPAAGAKGYGLMMMIDILAGSMLGLPFGKHVSMMQDDLSKGRGLGQFIIVINPDFFGNAKQFKENITQMVCELHDIKPAPGVDKVLVPGDISKEIYKKYQKEGIPVHKTIYDYLIGDKM